MISRTSLILITFFSIACNAQISKEIFEISKKYYQCVYNSSMTMARPSFMRYEGDNIDLLLANKNKFTLKSLKGAPVKAIAERRLPDAIRQYIDSRGITFELIQGTVRTSTRKIISTKEDYKTFMMVPDKERSMLYFLARPEDKNQSWGSLFSLDTSRAAGDFNPQEVTFLGDSVMVMAIEAETGNIALSVRTKRNWDLVVLKKVIKPATAVITTTTPKIETTTEDILSQRADFDVALEELVEESKQKIRELFIKDILDCLALQKRSDVLMKNYAKTMELDATEISLARKENLPPTVTQGASYDTIAGDIDLIFENIVNEFQKLK